MNRSSIALVLGCLLGIGAGGACGGSGQNNGGKSSSGNSNGASAGSGGDLGNGSGSLASTSSGSSANSGNGSGGSGLGGGAGTGASAGSSSASSSAAGTDAGSGGVADGGADGGDGSSVVLGNCKPADITPCATYANPSEDGGSSVVTLGPYGAQADPNVGKGFENTIQTGDSDNNATCSLFVGTFNEPSYLNNQLLTTTMNGITIDFSLYSAYRPAIWPKTPVPVITWGDGTCAQPEGYGALLRYVASYGYFIIAANSRWVGSTNTDGSQPMLKALDYAAAANMDPKSPYYQKLDMTKVGAMGHSQGGMATITASSDSRIKDVIVFNGGDTGVAKTYLAVSGDMDITNATVQSMTTDINAATVPAAWLYYHNPVGAASDTLKGHLVLMLTPERVTAQTVAWWEMWFRNDAASKADFVGSSCGFCGHTSDATNAYDYGHNSMLQ